MFFDFIIRIVIIYETKPKSPTALNIYQKYNDNIFKAARIIPIYNP